MQKITRVICLLSVMAIAICCFAGCKRNKQTASETASQAYQDMKPTDQIKNTSTNDLPDMDLKGVTLKCAAGDESVLFPDETVNELSKRRKAWIEQCKSDYNFDLEFVYYQWDKMTEELMPELLTGEYVADFVLPAIRQAGPFIQANLCANLNEDVYSYLDFSKSWWDRTMLKASTINGKTYCCTPQFTSSANTTWVMFFNYSILEEIGSSAEELYKMQDEGTWTWEAFRALGRKAVLDKDNNGKMEATDRWGFVAAEWHISQCFMTVSGAEYVTEDANGKLIYNLNNSYAIEAIQTMNNMFTSDGFYRSCLAPAMQSMFANDLSLFMAYQVQACQGDYLRNMSSDFGMLLMPKYKENMDYISRAEQTTYCCFIPVTCQYKTETAFALQALSYNAWKIGVPDIMELNFAQYVRDDGSAFCINEVFNHTTFTIDQVLYDVGTSKKWKEDIIDPYLSKPCTRTANMDVSAAVAQIQTWCQTLLDEFYAQTTAKD